MLNKIVFLLLAFTSSSILLNGQMDIKGKVLDAENLAPLIGVSILNLSNSEGSTTDFDGTFTLSKVEKGSILRFSYLGYTDIEKEIVDTSFLSVSMELNSVLIDNVVITGLGIKRQQREVGYSTESIGGDVIARSNASNIVNALSGKSAGVNIVNSNGVDGGTTRITIRGNNNIKGNNQPLIIVDGVPIENPPGLTNIGRGVDWGSAINTINSEDIEDINILKGPTASAKYGMRGANGVILIRTKKGKERKGLGIEYSISHKMIQAYRYREVQDVYGAGGPVSLLEPSFQVNAEGEYIYPTSVHTNNGPYGRPTTEQFGYYSTGVSWGPKMEGQMLRWWDGELRGFDPQPENLKQFFSPGRTSTHNLNFSNGGEFGSMRVSLTYQDHEAVVPNSNYKQYSFNLGSELNISKKLKSDISLSYVNYNRLNSPSLGDDNNSSFGKGILYSWPRSYKGLEEDLNFNQDGSLHTYNGNYPFTYTPSNLWWNTYNQNTYFTRNKLIGSLGLHYYPTTWLMASMKIGTDFNLNEFEKKYNPSDVAGLNGGLYSHEMDRNIVVNSDFLLTAFKDNLLNSHFDLSLSFGGSRWQRNQYGINASVSEWENPWLFSFNNYSGSDVNHLPLAREIRYNKMINSLYSFLNIDYKEFLFLELSGRNDWSSSLPLENNSYFYPSASLSFILSEITPLPVWFNFAKLRASFAQTASDTDPFLLDYIFDTGSFSGQQSASLPSTKPPADLKPQQANSVETGLTLGFFADRINLDLTYYHIRSFDQILDSPTPSSSGVSQIRINNGVLENSGFECLLKAQILKWKDGYFSTGINLAQNKNFVKSLGDGADFLEIGEIWGDFGPKIMVREGQQYGTIYGYDHIYHSNGQPLLNDAGTHYQISENLVPVGNAAPLLTGGWTMEFKYKNFRVQSLIDSKIKGDIYAGSYVIGLQTGQSPETLYERNENGLPFTDPEGNERNIGVILPGVYENGSKNEEIVHYYYKYLPNAGGWGKVLTTPGILDNSWVKLRELNISYDLSDQQLSKLKIFQNMSLSIIGRDLFYFYTSLPDKINPEGSSGSGNAQGLEWAAFPGMRSISIRLRTNF